MRQLRMTIEDCPIALDAAMLTTAGVLADNRRGIIRWPGNSVEFKTELIDRGISARLLLRYWFNSNRFDRQFTMRTCSPDFRRWAFACPCHRRRLVETIYLVNIRFQCRFCGDLGYSSRRRSHALSTAKLKLALCGFDARCLSGRDLVLLSGFDQLRAERLRPTIEITE